MSDRSPGQRLRSEFKRAKATGGPSRQRGGGRMVLMRNGPRCVPDELAFSRGNQFPVGKATAAQERKLNSIITRYLCASLVRRHPGFPATAFAPAMGLSRTKAADVVNQIRAEPCSAEATLALDILTAMAAGEIAGALGTRKTDANRYIFERVLAVRVEDIVREFGGGDGDQVTATGWDATRILKSSFDNDCRLWLKGS